MAGEGEMTGDDGATPARSTPFEVVLYPNQPPPARNLAVLLAAVFGVAIGVSVGFVLAGAWPVVGFIGAELLLLVTCLTWARRMARYAEHIRLDETGLWVRTTAGRQILRSWRFEPYWVRVQLDEVVPGEPVLKLSAHGHTLTVGRFLSAEERSDVAAALEDALLPYRRPMP